jgi:hypothetical protein
MRPGQGRRGQIFKQYILSMAPRAGNCAEQAAGKRRGRIMIRNAALLGLTIALTFGCPFDARAVAVQGVAHNVPYLIAFRPLHSQQQPYLGQMHLNFNNGIISGTYTDLSIRPGSPFANARNIAVTGGTSSNHVRLVIGNITFRGSVNGDHMSGSATIRGTIYNFDAHPGSPGSGK